MTFTYVQTSGIRTDTYYGNWVGFDGKDTKHIKDHEVIVIESEEQLEYNMGNLAFLGYLETSDVTISDVYFKEASPFHLFLEQDLRADQFGPVALKKLNLSKATTSDRKAKNERKKTLIRHTTNWDFGKNPSMDLMTDPRYNGRFVY